MANRDYEQRDSRDYPRRSGGDGERRGNHGGHGGGRRDDRRDGRRDNYRDSRRDGGGRRDGYRQGGDRRRDFDDEPREGTLNSLVGHFHALDRRSYAAYKAIIGHYDTPAGWTLHVDRVQPDPYAPPTAIRIIVPCTLRSLQQLLHAELLETADRRLAVADFLGRELHAGFKGTALSIAAPGQEILERSSVALRPASSELADSPWVIEVRARVALPAQGRTIMGREAARIIGKDLVHALEEALDLSGDRATRLRQHVNTFEDYQALRTALQDNQWVSFLADGAVLPRRSGVSDQPLPDAVALEAPESLAATVALPHAGEVRGTAIEPGVTVIVGGGYHGKSTLLSGIERGVYAHVPGDGRELVATNPDAAKVRAADGRAVCGVDLSAFISHLPAGGETTAFSTGNASGSTSQAASIMEALEAGSQVLLLDEDTSATNLLIRDARMRALVAAEREPITPLVDRIRALHSQLGVSTIMVMGGSGDYLDVADRVLMMDAFHLRDVTEQARAVALEQPREQTEIAQFPHLSPRIPLVPEENSRRGPSRTRAKGTGSLTLDRDEIDVSDVAGIVDPGQAEAIAHALRALLEQRIDGESTVAECLEDLDALLDEEGLDALQFGRDLPAFMVRPRMVDVAGALNRYRKLRVAAAAATEAA